MSTTTTAKCENCDFEVEGSPVRVFALSHVKRTGHVVKVVEIIEVPD